MQAHEGRDYYLTLIEISVQELEHADGRLYEGVWPSFMPRIDGAFVLYDASDASSFAHTEELISELTLAWPCLSTLTSDA